MLVALLGSIVSAFPSTLYGLANAYIDCIQEKEWDANGQFIQLKVEANVDPYNWGTFSRIGIFDSLTGDQAYLYIETDWLGLSTVIPSLADAEVYFAAFLETHLANYPNPTVSGWVELDIADEPDYFSWNYINDNGSPGSINTSLDWWVDWDQNGARFSNSRPSDFGKWMWNGSINPSWTAAKKGYAKGHIRQPLPSPK